MWCPKGIREMCGKDVIEFLKKCAHFYYGSNYTPATKYGGGYTVLRLSSVSRNIFVSVQYLGKTLMDFYQILHMH